ncbi:unnamed protein product, partial [Darwinula stevensoni]
SLSAVDVPSGSLVEREAAVDVHLHRGSRDGGGAGRSASSPLGVAPVLCVSFFQALPEEDGFPPGSRARERQSFGQNYPEEFDGILDSISVALTCAFNRRGSLLAVGCNDGRITVWDFLTRGICKVISAHVHPVCSLSWSRSGHKLLSASTDNNVCIWDVLTGDCEHRYRFPSPVLKVQFNPRDDEEFLVCPLKHAAVLVNVNSGHKIVPAVDEEVPPGVNSADAGSVVAAYDRRGLYLLTGNFRGKVLVLNVKNLETVASFRSSQQPVKGIEVARRTGCFLVNTADRVIRVYDLELVISAGKDAEPEPLQKLQDLVNRTMWKKCCFSGDGEYVCAGSGRSHSLYIWERGLGSLVKILHGTKGELLLDVVWHPLRPIIASVSSGVVDVCRVDPIVALCSSDEEGDGGGDGSRELLFLPTAPDVEDPEESAVNTGLQNGHEQDENTSPKRKKPRVSDIELDGAPVNEVHPMLAGSKGRDRAGNGAMRRTPKESSSRRKGKDNRK